MIDGIDLNGQNFQQRSYIEKMMVGTLGRTIVKLNQKVTAHTSLAAAVNIYPGIGNSAKANQNKDEPNHEELFSMREAIPNDPRPQIEFVANGELPITIMEYIEYDQKEKYACLDFEKNQFIDVFADIGDGLDIKRYRLLKPKGKITVQVGTEKHVFGENKNDAIT